MVNSKEHLKSKMFVREIINKKYLGINYVNHDLDLVDGFNVSVYSRLPILKLSHYYV